MVLGLIYGRNSVADAIENGVPLKTIYTIEKLQWKVEPQVKVVKVTKAELDQMTSGANHQGVAAELQEVVYYDLNAIFKDQPSKVLVLDHVQDPQNLGAIIRSANAFGVKHIVIPRDRAAKISSAVYKVASGGMVNIKIIRVSSLYEAVKTLKEKNFWVYASALNEKAKSIEKVSFNTPLAIIVGNEQTGVSTTLQKIADEIFFIPMEGTVQSLNVSVATAIILFLTK